MTADCLETRRFSSTMQDITPDILTVSLQVNNNTKNLALTMTNFVRTCHRNCFYTQVPSIITCTAPSLEQHLAQTEQMSLLSGNHEVLEELSSNSLAHLQISLDSNAADILYHLCTTKLTTLLRTFQKFETFGPLELYPLLHNAGLIGIRRGENGIILSCVPTMVVPTILKGYCCANQPVLLPDEKRGTTPTHFLEPLTHQILTTCDPLTCSDILLL